LAEVIDGLRKRWKDIDRLGGATNQRLWTRFDAALKAAYEPVAAHQAQLKARRQENLAAREQLLAQLDAQALPSGSAAMESAEANEPDAALSVAQDTAATPQHNDDTAWKDVARALEAFQLAWRKLGPLEHTVPHKARTALQARLQASIARLEAPLSQVRQSAQAQREQLVQRAQALANSAGGVRDPKVALRDLQSEWQHQARALPLPRAAEVALWNAFRAACDAVVAQRDAAHQAREAELLANQARREALIAGLQALTPQSPAELIKRSLADADAQWRVALQVPRAQVQVLEAQFLSAREQAARHLADQGRLTWHAGCDALSTRVSLCEQLEATSGQAQAGAAWVTLESQWT
jgi:DNA repair protein SbcC/Rad50